MMNVELTPELEKLVETKVRSGRYLSASEVVRDALRLLEARDEARAVKLSDLRGHMDRAIAECDRDDMVDGEAFMSQMIEELDAGYQRKTG